MPGIRFRLLLPFLSLLAGPAFGQSGPVPDPGLRAEFLAQATGKYGLPAGEVEAWLARASYRQSIVDAMARPAEAVKPWKDYRPIFLTGKRIADGRLFLARHREALAKVEADTGVPAEMIVAILGVETSYGSITGSYPVLDALYTLGFFYPASGKPEQVERERRRGAFFRDELAQVMRLADEEGLDLASLRGSYAGAMGWGQFMPSSYRAYARDGDGDGRRDLFRSLPDVFASVANYFVAHGWEPGAPVAMPAVAGEGARFQPDGLEARYSLAELGEAGFRPAQALGEDRPATLVTLEGDAGVEHWLGFRNFYVITRYNRSPMYALAVYQLSREIAAAREAALAP
ncbi:lytic murein transglycosylase B [Arenimonas fontis]|uniref:Lytic murein transglycosylase B n=1 Tax=Arenimonas fontis TaxID=2608255 RepID=A0A5B2Z4T0_9GAMM|nr:lytic murein transglycosylase B [Arenimonas fontis]KAA2283938.1 lytic murein transglycosylase B [Arenimonas fontis]